MGHGLVDRFLGGMAGGGTISHLSSAIPGYSTKTMPGAKHQHMCKTTLRPGKWMKMASSDEKIQGHLWLFLFYDPTLRFSKPSANSNDLPASA
jgi:hypothetical protein